MDALGPGGRRSIGSNRELSRPDLAGWEASQHQTRGCDAIAHLKFTGVEAAMAMPRDSEYWQSFELYQYPIPHSRGRASGKCFPVRRADAAGTPRARRIEGDRFTRLPGAIDRCEVILYSLASFDSAGRLEKPRKEQPAGIQIARLARRFAGS
jgi:hypothetical protein